MERLLRTNLENAENVPVIAGELSSLYSKPLCHMVEKKDLSEKCNNIQRDNELRCVLAVLQKTYSVEIIIFFC